MKLFKQQHKALEWSNGKDNFACFMEMRTGKSLVAVEKARQWNGKVVLIAPISTWYDWQKLLGSLGIYCTILQGTTKQKQQRLDKYAHVSNWLLTNPEGLPYFGKSFFMSLPDDYTTCILDESVFIKNPKSKTTKMLMKHRDMFEHRIIMTGTPIAEQTEDVVTQMIWCYGSFMGYSNFYGWRIRYMYPGRFGWYLRKGVKQLIREELKKHSFVMSAKDAGMFTKQVKKTHLVELPADIAKDYKHIEKHWRLQTASTKYGVVKDIWLSQLASGIYPKDIEGKDCLFKINAIASLVDGELYGQQIIFFTRWLKETYALANELQCPCITGNVPYNDREGLLNGFRNSEYQYLVMQSKTACRGLDLSCCNTAVICSNYWQYEIRKQIEARMNHPNRVMPTLIIDVIAKDTIEEKVYELLQSKHGNARFFLQRLRVKVK